MLTKCPVCQSDNIRLLSHIAKGRLVDCHQCHLIFYTPRPTPKDLELFYNSDTYRDSYQDSPMTGLDFAKARYKQLTKIIYSHAPALINQTDKQFLDVGCGVGDLLSIAQKNGWQITGTEISHEATETANILLKGKVLTGDIISLDLPQNYYDLITIYHVIEHLIDPIETLVKIRQLLKPGGIAFIETPNIGSLGARIKGKNWSQIFPPEHITYFQPSSLKFALEKAEFQKFKVFTNAPHIVESTAKLPQIFKAMATIIYRLAPLGGLGAALQAVAFKE